MHLEDLLQVEKDRLHELRAIKDKSNHHVYKTVADSEEMRMKEQDLTKKL